MAVAVICEFNPFHNGHKYLLETAKKITNEPVIAIMSGSFTQRGEVAVCDKFTRARAALQSGADLVIELPVAYSIANAQRFAMAGAEIAKAFGCVNYLAFGCETDDIKLLLKACSAFENIAVQELVKKDMKSGNYYPRAFEAAVRKIMGDSVADVLTTPNNILGVEYLRGISNSKIKPLPIKRIGTPHDSSDTSGNFASASYIRELMRNGGNAEKYVPYPTNDITFEENLERVVLFKLRGMSAEDFAQLPDVGEGLENRILSAVNNYNSVKEIIESVKTKRYTHARIRRIIACALLGITEELQNVPIEYVRVLGFTDEGSKLLKECSKNVVTSVSKGIVLGGNIEKLLKKDIYATDIALLAYDLPKQRGADFVAPIIKL